MNLTIVEILAIVAYTFIGTGLLGLLIAKATDAILKP